jgi:two-component system NtrC family sensor kinase
VTSGAPSAVASRAGLINANHGGYSTPQTEPPNKPRRGNLTRRFVLGFLIATIPGTIVLGLFTIYSIRSLVAVNRQLDEISLSLEATDRIQLALFKAEATARAFLLHRPDASPQAFEGAVHSAQEQLTSCASASCHGTSRLTTNQMAASLSPRLERLRIQGLKIFEVAGPAAQSFPPGEADEVDQLASWISRRLQTMAETLVGRVATLREQSQALSQRALTLMILVSFAVVVMGSCIAAFLANRVSRPIQSLLQGTRRVRAGDWGHRVMAGSGEIGELALSFNAMVEEVERYRDQLNRYSHNLEERVMQRTEELKRKDEALRQSEKLASLGLLASGVAHELNNPLTGILMNANLLIEEVGPNSPLYGELKRIDEDAGRCRRIIDDLRTFSRRHELRKARCRPEEVIDQALRLVEHELDRRGIRIERRIEAGLPEVFWDSERMVQVMTNLFVNAAQAMEGGGCLSVSAQLTGNCLTIEVKDTGVGIPEENHWRVFEPFFTTKRAGTGLGLSISYGIIEEHMGRLEMESRTREAAGPDGQTGTSVKIVLPLLTELKA